MVNEERLHHMIKMAIFDTDQGKECKPMTQYARKDYVSLRMLGSFVSGTIGFALIAIIISIVALPMGHLFHEPVNGESECNGYSGTADIRAGKVYCVYACLHGDHVFCL